MPNPEHIQQNMDEGAPVSLELAAGGRIFIERAQPFLCLIRQPTVGGELNAAELVTTQASYIIVEEDDLGLASLQILLKVILGYLQKRFGSVLLIEMWAGEAEDPDPVTELFPPRLVLYAQSHDAPAETLDELQKAVIESIWVASRPPKIEIVYESVPGPPKMGRLLPRKIACDSNVHLIGMEFSPFFRAPETGELLPQIFSELRNNIGHCIKRAVYTYAQNHSNFDPVHYHEFGPEYIDEISCTVDAELVQIDDALSVLLNVTPVNVEQAWNQFRKKKFGATPEFHYRALRISPSELKRRLFSTPIESVEDTALHQIFESKRIELDRQLTMLADRGTKQFLLESQQIYGGGDAETVEIAKRILTSIPAHTHDDVASKFLDAGQFARRAELEVKHYKKQDPAWDAKVIVREDIPGLMVSKGQLLISHHAKVPRHRVEATLQHEIGTHALTYRNGGCQPLKLLQVGLAGYEELQEGLAVLAEHLVGGLSRPRIRQVAGRVIAVSQLVDGAGFVEVYRSMHDDFAFNQNTAFNITMRVFRGGGFTKDAIYLRGLLDLLKFIQSGEDIESLFLGKIALQHVEITSELLWRKILKPPKLVPVYLDSAQAIARLKKIQVSENALDVVLEQLS